MRTRDHPHWPPPSGCFVQVWVRFLNRYEPQPSVPSPKVDLANVGHIALGPDAHRHQTLFRGDSPQIYRVHCDEGVMKVLVDGQP